MDQSIALKPWNEDVVFIGMYAGIKYYSRKGKIICLFDWKPMEFVSISAFKRAVNQRESEED